MAPGLEIVDTTSPVEIMKEEVLHIENPRPLKKHKLSQTKNFTAQDIVSFATPPAQNYDLLQASPYSDREILCGWLWVRYFRTAYLR